MDQVAVAETEKANWGKKECPQKTKFKYFDAGIEVNLFKFKLWKCLQVVSLFEATNGNRHFWDE